MKYIKLFLAKMNAWLKSLFSASTSTGGTYVAPSTTTDATNVADVNAALANTLELWFDTNGVPQLRVKAGL